MSNVKFTINTIKREKEIANMVSKNVEFFKINKVRFTWPEKPVEEEYDINKYKEYKERIEKEWKKRGQGFVMRLLTFFHLPKKFQFIIEISNYGPLGFYNADTNTITVNLNTHLDAIDTIMHEMVHIMVEPFIKKYDIKYERKEFIVDTILKILKMDS